MQRPSPTARTSISSFRFPLTCALRARQWPGATGCQPRRIRVWWSGRKATRVRPKSAPIIAPHPQEGAVDLVRRLVERLEIHPHHIVVAQTPRQTHEAAPAWLLAPVDDNRTAERRAEHDLQLVHGHCALGNLNEVDA